ncbi:nitrite reductase small subunit NirD [Halalkalibacter nanhaiisediminis]|uniref:Nitrite reductase (NADH) small subunit n=1 Tax=Halalkalibacter nanhaiisediminis TaxID=688079 RepID=A0A562QBF6_9BACI|nr:nitrite reductase small subunit NirD [Halalkalibacter nanhaiisediminis]TWI54053.1 nitrite reductase (NADH) small subunit [Halalkalibacter nanhaiisediminis]
MSSVRSAKKVHVADVSDLSIGIGKRVQVAAEEIALFLQSDQSVHAIQNKCPHKGGPLSEGIVSGEHVFCPLHDRKVNVRDGLVQAPDEGCVKRYDVEIIDEGIYVYID